MHHRPFIERHALLVACVADAAKAVFMGTVVVIAFAAVSEYFRPGTAASYLPSQGLFVLAVASGALSLLAPETRRGRVRRVLTWVIGLAVASGVAFAAWRYFGPLDGMRLPLTAAATAIVGLAFAALGRVAETEEEV